MPKFQKGDILIFEQNEDFFETVLSGDIIYDSYIIIYIDDVNYYLNNSVSVPPSTWGEWENDTLEANLNRNLMVIPIEEIDNGIRKFTVGLKTLLKKL